MVNSVKNINPPKNRNSSNHVGSRMFSIDLTFPVVDYSSQLITFQEIDTSLFSLYYLSEVTLAAISVKNNGKANLFYIGDDLIDSL